MTPRQRATLIINVCALIVALVANVEGAYIIYHIFGWFNRSDWLAGFVPVIVMFVIRNREFSYLFLFLYIALATQMGFQTYSVYSGAYKYAGEKYPLGYLGALFVASFFCLAIYAAFVSIRFLFTMCIRSFRSRDAIQRK